MQSSSFVVVPLRGRSVGLDDHAKGVTEERPPIGAEPGRRRRGVETKVPVAVALELTEDGMPRRVAMSTVARVVGHSLKRFATANVQQDSALRTDGWGASRSVAKADYAHEAIPTGGGRTAVQTFPWRHTFISNRKRMLRESSEIRLGTYHGVSTKHLDDSRADFPYRANRRWMEGTLVAAAIDGKSVRYKELLTGAK